MTPRQRLIVSVIFVVAVLATVGWFFATLMATPASARCFSVWHFSKPQHCGAQVAENKPVPMPAPKPWPRLPGFTVSPLQTIVLTPVPGRSDDEGRADAILVLRELMQ